MSDKETSLEQPLVTDTISENIPKVTPETLVEDILAGAERHNLLTKAIVERHVFLNKTLLEWSKHLSVHIPPNCSPEQLNEIFISFLNKLQTCNALYTRAQASLTAIEQGSDARRSDIISALVDRYEERQAKRPAAAVLNQMADSYLDIATTRTAAKIIRDFFKDQRDTLIECRKIFEQMNFTMHLEAKLKDI